ncbi:hypothetical protein HYH03_016855 [Edaphochlamys debaryana]|uniref:Uncharacterized protein n=1 Tax=Edaphochlamys debaryana TaxID=47281 RepID=A0A835XJH4_9CHLO|nr:hypothetical protein HYH03_016855 [Edaphochlamys debaryana]|eukprot:KAG2484312.1 hypothetical protein HYH03_016855 [Edaphochlamys debaryana]
MDGGIFGAVERARERKVAVLARQDQEKTEAKARRQRYKQRVQQREEAQAAALLAGQPLALPPAQPAGALVPAGPASGALSDPHRLVEPSEVAALLTDLNGGTPPSLDELLPVLLECGGDPTGRLPAAQLTAVVVRWNRVVRQRGLPGLGGSTPAPGEGDGRGCTGCCAVS